jgi:hypothetical protein
MVTGVKSPKLVIALCWMLCLVAAAETEEVASGPRVAILNEPFSTEYAERIETICDPIAWASLRTTFVSADELADEQTFSADSFDCLVLPDAALFPAPAIPNFLEFLRSGGDLVVIGGPIFDKLLYHSNGRWQTREEVLSSLRPEKIVLDLSKVTRQDWHHGTSNPDVESNFTIRKSARDDEPFAELSVNELPGWNTYGIKLSPDAFPEGHSLVCFRASGDGNTPNMALEIQEKDGSRWFAVVPLQQETRGYALPVDEFKFWQHGSPTNRGRQGDRLNLSNADNLVIGLARSHNSLPEKGPFSFRISSIGSAKSPFPDEINIPVLETLYPWYKTYTTKAAHRLRTRGVWLRVPVGRFVSDQVETLCPFWRSRGLGCRNPSPYRWVPIIYGSDYSWRRGEVAGSLTLNFEGEFANSHWLQIGLLDLPSLKSFAYLGHLIAHLLEKMQRNVFIRAGGVDRASYFDGQEVTFGYVLNSTPPPSWRTRIGLSYIPLRATVGGNWRKIGEFIDQEEGSVTRPVRFWDPPRYVATIELLDDRGRILDTLFHEFTVHQDKPAASDEIVRVEGCDFILKGKRWYPHGMNYWPSSWGGREPNEFRQHWLSPSLYDPQVVETNLAVAEGLGMNSLSIQLNQPDQIPAVNDFLFRCRQHGIYVNLFLQGGHPLQPDLELLATFLAEGRFAGNPAIWAYDIAWEPHVGEERQRKRLDPDWQKWIEEQYGNIEEAEKDWNFELRKENGGITTPTQNQILNPADWNVMVAAYRRFLDDLISRRYGKVTRHIREVDPTHLIGVRTGYGGTGEMGIDFRMPFDLISGAKHLDFISPEGYGLSPDWKKARAAGFTTLYGRFAGNGKPVFWAEFGRSVHPHYDEAAFTLQKNIYENMYRLVLDSVAQGSAGWWFPGGYRLGEDSDYGVVFPDLTPRPAALVLKGYAEAITGQPPLRQPHAWITIDRDLHPRGYSQIRKRHEAEYIRLREEGRIVALRTPATGTTSATVPDVAVGNVPYTGRNPHKYLNAEFNSVRLVLRDKSKLRITNGQTMKLPKGEPVRLEVSVGNTGEPVWLEPRRWKNDNGVFLSCSINGESAKGFPIPHDLARYHDCEIHGLLLAAAPSSPTRITLRMEASRKATFGEKFDFTLAPE